MSFSKGKLSQFWWTVQGGLFPWLAEELGPLSERQKQLIAILELVGIERFASRAVKGAGRPVKDRGALARAFVAKAVYRLETTRQLREQLLSDVGLRRLCGWERARAVPSEATFSRAFAEFAEGKLGEQAHAQVIERYQKPRLVGHIARDATAIAVRERRGKKRKKAGEGGCGKRCRGKRRNGRRGWSGKSR
jgi:hypothetical protein